jgi:hypothetical protein
VRKREGSKEREREWRERESFLEIFLFCKYCRAEMQNGVVW